MDESVKYVQARLQWLRANRIWPNGLRYLWTDAFGVVLLVSLYEKLSEPEWLEQARWLVAEVERVLGRERGIRIGEAADRDGQYFHYLAMWMYALAVLGRHDDSYRRKGVELVKQVHRPFYVPGHGVVWKMQEDLNAPYPGFGLGAMDAYDGYIAYRVLDEHALAPEIADMRALIDRHNPHLRITQDLGLGMMLWLSHFFPDEAWAVTQKRRCLHTLSGMWRNAGYFCREPGLPTVRFAFTNYGVSIGLQAVGEMPDRVRALHDYFETYRAHDEYDTAAITHVMACSAHFPGRMI